VLDVEVGIDERPQLAAGRRLLYGLNHTITNLFQTLFECFRKQVLFAVKVTIEATMGEAKVSHEIADACTFASPVAEATGCRSDDSFTRLPLVFGAVSHDAREMLYIISLSNVNTEYVHTLSSEPWRDDSSICDKTR
jgi:hypothetical protein